MFFKKALLKKNSKLKALTIDSFAGGLNSVIDDAYIGNSTAKLSYNVVGDSGVLKENKGLVWFKKAQQNGFLPVGIEGKKIKKAWYYKRFDNQTQTKDDQMVLLAEDNTLYALPLNQVGGAQQIDARPFNAIPYAVNYRLKGNDVIIFCSSSDDMRVYDGVNQPRVVVDAPKVTSMCIHYDRLFATTVQDKNTLVFSDDLDPTNWNIGIEEAGYITMTDDRGALVKVVSFLNNLYVFREYGISRLVAYGQQSSFSLSHLFLSTGKIFGDTVVVCGNTILFLTELGLFQFDGSNTKKILSNLDGYFVGVDNTHAQADFCDGKYYLTANLNFDDGMTTFAEKNCTNNAIVEVDLIKGSVNFLRGFDASCVVALKGEGINGLFVCFGGGSDYAYGIGQLQQGGKIFESNTLKVWVCPNFDLNSLGQKKKLCYVTLLTKDDVTLVFTVDDKEYFFDLVGKPNGQTIPINLVGENFGLKIVATTPTMYVSRPQLVFKEY